MRIQLLLVVLMLAACQDSPTTRVVEVEHAAVECFDQTDCADPADLDELLAEDLAEDCFIDGTTFTPSCNNGVVSLNEASDLPNCANETLACPPQNVCIHDARLPSRLLLQSVADCSQGHGPSCLDAFCTSPEDITHCWAPDLNYDSASLDVATKAKLMGRGPTAPEDCASPNTLADSRGTDWCLGYHRCQAFRLTSPVAPGWLRILSGEPGNVTVEDWLYFSTPEGCRVDALVDKSQASPAGSIESFTCADAPCEGLRHVGCTPI
jgi:hypothetical protein